jgi:uracil-DNA glycosylase
MDINIYFSNIHPSWMPIFNKHLDLIQSIFQEINDSYPINVYPSKDKIFRVFEMNVLDIKLVLLGQDSYHGFGQANGLAFSVDRNVKIPPSLNNIYKELKNTYPDKEFNFNHGDLSRWFNEEKIFLLNCGLCVYEGKPCSFLDKWTPFTNDIIQFISENNNNCVFLLLGNYAIKKMEFIKDTHKNRCITGVHPSPLSAYRGFLGSKIFNKVDEKIGYEINWII